MRLRLFPSLFLTVLIVFSIVLACRKLDSQVIKSPEAFSVNVAKEWWYGTFRKSGDYSKTDFSSPLAPPEGSSTKKYPRWKHAITYSIGGLQIVELPLEYETNSILLPGMQNLYNTPEGARIAQSAIHKLLLIKKRNGAIVVRTVTLVPKPKYAKKLYYDLSGINLQKLPTDFSGYQMIGGWDESLKNIIEYAEGKGIRRVNIVKRGANKQRNALQSQTSANMNGCLACEIWVPEMNWVCVIVPSGDDLADQERCRENGHWVESSTEGQCQSDPNCEADEPDPMEDCLATGATSEECACQVYMIGCDDDGGGDGEEGPTDCSGIPNGTAYIDDCGDCVGGHTGLTPCDPCADAQTGANNTNAIAQTTNYSKAKNDIQSAANNDGNEHSVTFGRDANGSITTSSMTTGNTNSGVVNANWPGGFADLHNHPDGTPPSAGDFYGIVSIGHDHSGYNTRYVTSGGEEYAYVIIDQGLADAFKARYPKMQIGNNPPEFPDPVFNDYDLAKSYFEGYLNYDSNMADAMAIAFVLEKYNAGVVLLKKGSDGNFKRLRTTSTESNGTTTYQNNNCQ